MKKLLITLYLIISMPHVAFSISNVNNADSLKNSPIFSNDDNKVIVIGISGASGSGKTFLANKISENFNSEDLLIINEDRYYRDQSHLTHAERELVNYDNPKTLDHDLLVENLIQLKQKKSVMLPNYDFKDHIRLPEYSKVNYSKIIIVEGILVFSDPKVRDLLDIKIFVDTPLDLCILRRIDRDTKHRGRTVNSVMTQYLSSVRPMYFKYIAPSKDFADLIIPGIVENNVAADLVKSKISQHTTLCHENYGL